MPIAFVISTAEENVVHTVLKDSQEPYPRLDGSLFTFRPIDLPDFMKAVRGHAKGLDRLSEEYRAAMRLVERLGAWIGKQIVAGDPNQPDLFNTLPLTALRASLLRKLVHRTTS